MIMQKHKIIFTIVLIILNASNIYADCSLDHFEIGINPDGIVGTGDDLKLFVDCSHIYRHSDPLHNQDPTWAYWHYPLYYSMIHHDYMISEPGFDTIKSDEPNHCLTGTPLFDYDIVIECVSISQGLTGIYAGSPGFTISQAGDKFSHSMYTEPHMHFTWRAPTNSQLYWLTFRMYDALGKYQPSDNFSLVFIKDPLAGDLAIDGIVDMKDLSGLCDYWLEDNGGKENDYYQRADVNRDGTVNFADFALMANNWNKQQN
jgi:hypothetical protein